jgi:hypothetical protein
MTRLIGLDGSCSTISANRRAERRRFRPQRPRADSRTSLPRFRAETYDVVMIYAHAPDEPSRQSGPVQFRLRTLFVVVTVFCTASWLVGFLYRGVSRSLDAEMTHQAHIRTLDALTDFVQSNGRWPKSWDELISADAGQRRGLVGWLGGTKDLQSRVTVDFQLDLNDITAMTPEAFSAVTESEPNYGPNDYWVRGLLDAVRKARPASKSH